MRLRSGINTATADISVNKTNSLPAEEAAREMPAREAVATTGKVKAKETWSHWVYGILRSAAIVFLVLYIVIPVFVKTNPWIQTKIIFLNNLRWPPFINFSEPEHFGLEATRDFYLQVNQHITIGAWHVLPMSRRSSPPTNGDGYESLLKEGIPIILYLHGNSGTRAGWHRVQLYKLLSSMNYHVIAPDYRGYGDSTGSPSEDGVVADSYFVYRWIRERSGKTPVYLWGHSLGTGVTAKLAKQLCKNGEAPMGVVLESPFTNILEAAEHHPIATPFKRMPWFHWLFIDTITENDIHFESDQSIAHITTPILILHAEDDMIIPFELGEMLYQRATAIRDKSYGPVDFVSFNASLGYGHKLIFMAPELPDIVRKFLDRCLTFIAGKDAS